MVSFVQTNLESSDRHEIYSPASQNSNLGQFLYEILMSNTEKQLFDVLNIKEILL